MSSTLVVCLYTSLLKSLSSLILPHLRSSLNLSRPHFCPKLKHAGLSVDVHRFRSEKAGPGGSNPSKKRHIEYRPCLPGAQSVLGNDFDEALALSEALKL